MESVFLNFCSTATSAIRVPKYAEERILLTEHEKANNSEGKQLEKPSQGEFNKEPGTNCLSSRILKLSQLAVQMKFQFEYRLSLRAFVSPQSLMQQTELGHSPCPVRDLER